MAKMSLDEKIARLEKDLKNAKAKRSTTERKKRNGLKDGSPQQ